ncbi:hypothetical protein [Paraclostridium bifermentans]|uniref:hypothetical protein n=1 Tax=Paraclostridium bifermentans TaxID=1490 RepID=UPI00374FA600
MRSFIVLLTVFFSVGIVLEFCIRPIRKANRRREELLKEIKEQEADLKSKEEEWS